MIEKTLRNLGMTENEVKLYIVLLKSGPLASGEIIKRTEFQSSVVFHLLDKLIEKGFVGYVSQNKKKIYSASNPEVFNRLVNEREEEFEKIKKDLSTDLKELKKVENTSKEETKVMILKGTKGLQTIFNDVLNNSREFWTYSTRNTFSKIMPKYREYFREIRIAKKIKQKTIITDELRKPNRAYQEKRYVPKKYASPIGLEIYNKKVVIFIWDAEPPMAVVLEGDKVSHAFKNMFESMWKSAKR